MALKRLKKEGKVEWNVRLPPLFRTTVCKMSKVLLEFTEGNGSFDRDAVSAMQVYCTRKLGISSTVSVTS